MTEILVVEDDGDLNEVTCMYLRDAGYAVTGCRNVHDAYEAMHGRLFDLVLSDIMMPGANGYEFAEKLRELDRHIPIILMTARDDIASKKRGFHAGVDDYIVKPVDFEELTLRIEALLRRAHIEDERKLVVGAFVMDADQATASLDGEPIALTAREFNILYKLLSYPKQVFSRAQLMDEFWDAGGETSLRAVDVYITNLRKKIGACEDFDILTVRGLGYKAVPR
ncbi:DNA-binding response regulator [Bifidobacterium lemurum]|uniref:Heme response regulator HssR n=1 Tax=Bifidobacterium lemurum TaxID=1603886 RepID=A0A261FM05_9BIFI|nr:response regulator transcription factor [Bifidobacterium lemurum]OZG60201.1 DNA-binding response regulator [Bifidobacterium lemurum]QOL34100.1 response regulator transcription factor [Bifidobacterium lemurum]